MAAKKPNGSIQLKLKEMRNRKKLSLNDLGRITGFSPQYLNQLERGMCNPTLDTIAVLCETFDCSVGDLMVHVAQEDPVTKALVAA